MQPNTASALKKNTLNLGKDWRYHLLANIYFGMSFIKKYSLKLKSNYFDIRNFVHEQISFHFRFSYVHRFQSTLFFVG